eukprot:s617_g2.t3
MALGICPSAARKKHQGSTSRRRLEQILWPLVSILRHSLVRMSRSRAGGGVAQGKCGEGVSSDGLVHGHVGIPGVQENGKANGRNREPHR